VKQHLAAGTDVDVKGGFADGTSLHYAAANGHKEIAELLIAEEPIYRKPFALYENCNCIATRDNCCQTISKCSIARKNIDASH
jgi:ankyrin repeat protein